MHGGAAPQVRAAATRRTIEATARNLLDDHDTGPVTDPIEALACLVGEVLAWRDLLRDRVAELQTLASADLAGGKRTRATVELYERALDRAGRLLVAIGPLDLDARMVRVAEAQVELLFTALSRAMATAGVVGEPEARLRAALAAELRALSPAGGFS
jgi:hypothetical protein